MLPKIAVLFQLVHPLKELALVPGIRVLHELLLLLHIADLLLQRAMLTLTISPAALSPATLASAMTGTKGRVNREEPVA